MKTTYFFLFFLLISSGFSAYSQDSKGIYWQRCLGGYKNEGVSFTGFNYEPSQSDMVSTPDGGLIIATTTTSKDGDLKGLRKYKDSTNGHDGWVVKLNSAGVIEWSRCIGGSLRDEANTVAVVNGG